jgi:hypothetical protein
MARTPEQIIDELRAENVALKRVMIAMREKKGGAAMIELTVKDRHAHWIVTTPWPVLEREIAEAIARNITQELGKAFKLTNLMFSGTSIEEQGAEEVPEP